MTDQPQTLDEWRTHFGESDIQWLQRHQTYRERREDERQKRRRARSRRDRGFFGEEYWVARQRMVSSRWLQTYNLPAFTSEMAFAEWLEIPLSRLRWFTHNKPAETIWHYYRYPIPKRNGGTRMILAPKPELKALQRRLLSGLLERFPASESAHGFIKGRSIVTNAGAHVGRRFVLKLDLKDFFPGITVRRVERFFSQMYPSAVAASLAMLMTEYERYIVDLRGETFYVAIGERHLVQGAPTSPAMANILAYRLDKRLKGLAESKKFVYTRYADDLTFSGDDYDSTLRILDVAQRIVADEGFVVNKAKTGIKRQSSRQIVTGVVVNEKLSSPRAIRRRLRAILHRAQFTGLQEQNRDNHLDFRAYLRGLIGYLHDVNPEQAARYAQQLAASPD